MLFFYVLVPRLVLVAVVFVADVVATGVVAVVIVVLLPSLFFLLIFFLVISLSRFQINHCLFQGNNSALLVTDIE